MGANRPAVGTIQSEKRTCEFEDELAPDWFLNCMAVLCAVRVIVTKGPGSAWGHCFFPTFASIDMASRNVPRLPSKMAQFSSDRRRTSKMVLKAISNLKEGGGSSMQAIKKYIAGNYKIDSHKMTLDIKKFLKAAVASGDLVKAKGKGTSCFFKFPGAQARHRRAASSCAREQKQRAAKTKAKLAITTALKPTREKKTRTSPNKQRKCLPKTKKNAPIKGKHQRK